MMRIRVDIIAPDKCRDIFNLSFVHRLHSITYSVVCVLEDILIH